MHKEAALSAERSLLSLIKSETLKKTRIEAHLADNAANTSAFGTGFLAQQMQPIVHICN